MRELPLVLLVTLISLVSLGVASQAQAIGLQIQITSVNKKLEQMLLTSLEVDKLNKNIDLTVEKVESIHQKSLKKIKHSLAAYGYYNSNIVGSLKELNAQHDWMSSYDIQLGPATRITHINLQITGAANSLSFFQHYKITTLKKQQILLHKNYIQEKEQLIIALQEHGFLNAKYSSSQIRVDRNAHTATIVFFVNSGQQYVFGPVTFVNPTLDLNFLNRFIPFLPGEAYTSKQLMQLRNNLNSVDMFEKIKLEPQPDLGSTSNPVVPINVILTPKKNKRYTASLGYGTETGPRGSLGWQHRRINAAGHKVSASISGSKIRKKGQFNYIIPGKQPASDSYVINSTLQEESIEDIYYRQATFGVSKNTIQENYTKIWSARRLIETFKDLQQDKNINVHFLLAEAYYRFSNIEKQNEREYGTKFEFNAIGAANKLYSKTNLLKLKLDSTFIYSLVSDCRIIFSNSIGTILTPNFTLTPMSLRYFAGGEDTIRGFKLDSIGQYVLSNNGTMVNIGGKQLFLFSTEIDKPIWDKLSAAIFIDTGTAGNSLKQKFSTGAGVGLRWNTLIGAVKFDVAKPISRSSDKKLRFNISFGTDL